MRRYLAWAAAAAVLLAAAALAMPKSLMAAESPSSSAPARTIDVVGRGTVTAKPDTATLSFGVTALADAPTAAYAQVGKTTSAVSEAVKAIGVKEEQIRTQGLSLNAEYNWTQEKGQVLKGYRATTTLTITTQDLAGVAKLVEAAVNAGANQFQGISFSVKDRDALVDQAMDAAVDDAKAKADRAARRLGATLGPVVKVTVQDEGGARIMPEAAAAPMKSDTGAAIPVFSGTQDLTVTVAVSFELQ